MRNLLLVLFLWIASQAYGIELKDAFEDEQLEITIKGLDGMELGYADKDIWIGVLNLKDHPVTITVEPGFILHSEDGEVQDMIIIEPLEMIASSEYFNEAGVKAFCIQSGNLSPTTDDIFQPGEYAVGAMGLLAQYIHENEFANYMGQEAMWAISDRHSVYDINGYAEEANPLRHYVADLTGTMFDTSLVDKQVKYVLRTVKEYALNLRFYLDQKEDIKLQVFNQKGEFDRDLMIYPDQKAGQYNIRYHIALQGLIGEKYYVRLYVGEEMRNEFTLVIKDV